MEESSREWVEEDEDSEKEPISELSQHPPAAAHHQSVNDEGSQDDSDEDEDEDGEGGEEEEEEEDDGEDDEEEQDEAVVQSSVTQARKRGPSALQSAVPKKKKKASKRGLKSKSGLQFFEDEALTDDEEDVEEERGMGEEIIGEEAREAMQAVERRHEKARENLNRDARELAAEYERRARAEKTQRQLEITDERLPRGRDGAILQQSLLPSTADPSLFRVKVKTGLEQSLVMSVMRKAIDSKRKGGPLRIKSAFCTSSKGYIYIESIAEPLARDALSGLRGIFHRSFAKVPIGEMTAVISVNVTKKPLVVNQWVRIKRGALKGDLARIVDIYEGGSQVMIQAVPRPDYTVSQQQPQQQQPGSKSKTAAAKVRTAPPAQRLLDLVEARNSGQEIFRKYHPADKTGNKYDFWNGEYYRDGFLFKEVNPETYLRDSNVNPRIEEQKMFLTSKKRSSNLNEYDEGEPDDVDEDMEDGGIGSQSLLKELATQLTTTEAENDDKNAPSFVIGDLVQVTGGELRNLIARVVEVNPISKSVKATPYNSSLSGEFDVEMSLLVKYILPGAHVKVINGPDMGQTGRVVSVNAVEGKPVAAIITDGMNTEIRCDVANLQMSSEVSVGLGQLGGYELYDLVVLNDNESAVVIHVGTEKLRVLNHLDVVKDMAPLELHGKRNAQSIRSSAFDGSQNTLKVGDVVTVTSGPHEKKTGTIKHIMKGCLWLHSNSYLKNSGMFAIRARFCVVAGKKVASAPLVYGQMLPPVGGKSTAAGIGTKINALSKPSGKIAKDPNVGSTLRIIKGQFKGLLAQIVDATATSYTVELLAKMKRITIEKDKTVIVGDKQGSHDAASRRPYEDGGATPFYSAETPKHFGSETPRPIADTPMHFYGSETPGYSDPWALSNRESTGVSSIRADSHDLYGTSASGYGQGVMSGDRYSLGSGSGSNGASHYSPSGSVGAGSDSQFSPAASSSPGLGSNGSQTYASSGVWTEDMMVKFVSGQFAQQLAVVKSVNADGSPSVKLMNSTGGLVGKVFTAQNGEIAPLAPTETDRNCTVYVTSGSLKGKRGTLQTIVDGDAIVDIGNEMPDLFKLSSVAKIYSAK